MLLAFLHHYSFYKFITSKFLNFVGPHDEMNRAFGRVGHILAIIPVEAVRVRTDGFSGQS